jgi:hypothetical protein
MANLELGSTVGNYRIESVAGRGGMGVVYVATQLRLNRRVALKVITPDLAEDAGFRERFTHESQIAASIDHPNVIPVHEAGEHEGLLYLSMRYVEGTDLGRLLRAEGRVAPQRATYILAQVAEALDAAHAHGLVHRDVKPANILIAAGERTYLTDFGLTKHAESSSGLTKTGTWVGTVDYVAPEQIQGEHVDARSDVYALGCVLFHALAGQVPFPRPSEIAKIYAHMQDDPPAVAWDQLGVPPQVDGVLRRAMAKDPAARYQSAGDLGRAAVAATQQRQVTEPERTVAAGAAAAGAAALTAVGYPGPPTATGATQALPPVSPPPATYGGGWAPPPSTPPPVQKSSKLPLLIVAAVLLLAGAGVAVAAATGAFSSGGGTDTVVTQVTGGGGGGTDTGGSAAAIPASSVRSLLRTYERAYSGRDSSALRQLFTPDFVRHAPPKPPMDRSAAMAEYDRQFSQLSNPSYTLTDVRISTGPSEATAEAGYTIEDANSTPASGTIKFHMVDHDGELLIDAIDIQSS